MSNYHRYSVAIYGEEEARAMTGRAPRRPPPDGEVRRSTRTGASQVGLEEFWEEVVSGPLGLKPLPVKTPAEVSVDRDNAALLDRQLVALPPADFVSRTIRY